MDTCIRLAPPISVVSVKERRGDIFLLQVIPSSANSPKYLANSNQYISQLKPYEIQRKFEDFKLLHKAVLAVNVSISFPSTSRDMSIELYEYFEKLFSLPEEILEDIPVKKFFGEWIHDKLGDKRHLIPKPLASKLGAMISLGLDTNDDVLATILKGDDELRRSSTLPSKSQISQSPLLRSPSTSDNRNLHKKPRSQPQHHHHNHSHQKESLLSPVDKRDTVIPSFEEFATKLAVKLGVDPSDMGKNPSPSGGHGVHSRDNTHPRDTIRDTMQSRDTVCDTVRDTFLDSPATTTFNGSQAQSRMSIDTVLSDNVSGLTQLSLKDRSSNGGPRSSCSSYEKSLDSLHQSPKPLYSPIKINTKQHYFGNSPPASATSGSSSAANVVIPSRKESRNWTSDSPLASLNSASSSKSAEGKIQYRVPSSKKETSASSPSPLSAVSPFFDSHQQPPALALRSADSGSGGKTRILTLKIIPVSGNYTSIKVSQNLDYLGLLEKLCLIMGVRSMDLFRISYRDFDSSDLIVIADRESWDICLDTLGEDRLSIFINPK